jgi:hypothetical protein
VAAPARAADATREPPAGRVGGAGTAGWHDDPVPLLTDPPVPRARRRRAVALAVLTLLLVSTALGGCARVRAALAVQPDDTVLGEIVLATPEQGPDDAGPQVTLPDELADQVEVTEYREDGYAGSVLRFSGLTFAQLAQLTAAGGPESQKLQLALRRAGDRVLVSGAVDLTAVPVDRADFQLKINFPGQVLESNGDAETDAVSWVFTPGEVGDISALVAYDDPNAPSTLNWTLVLGGLVALAAAGVVALARSSRNPPVSPPVR